MHTCTAYSAPTVLELSPPFYTSMQSLSDPISLAAATVKLLAVALKASTTLLQRIDGLYEVRQTTNVTSFKLEVWQDTWSRKRTTSNAAVEALRGAQAQLYNIKGKSQEVVSLLQEVEDSTTTRAHTGWKRVAQLLRDTKPPKAKLEEIQETTSYLGDEVDAL
ncbi:MAG: hypothetical protein Q9214_004661 [Letrouitia sp. 1 TL-2023]